MNHAEVAGKTQPLQLCISVRKRIGRLQTARAIIPVQ
jgi:hypothetical protein